MEFTKQKAKEHIQARVDSDIKAEIGRIVDKTESNQSFVIESLLVHGLKAYSKTKPKKQAKSKAVVVATSNQVCELVTNLTGETFPIYADDITLWRESYGNVDIRQELMAIRSWLDANPSKRKTSGGMKRFINSWLKKAQDDYNPNKPKVAKQTHSTLTEIVNDDSFTF